MKPELRDALSRPFGPEMVRTKKGQGGREMQYISHGGVTKRLNDVASDWSAEMIERWITDTGGALHCVGGVMRLTIDGVTREEAGGPTRLGSLADDLKNTYSDCLKRCAMRFGVALDMWESAEENDEDADPFPTARPAESSARTAAAKSSAATISATNGGTGSLEWARAQGIKQFGPLPGDLAGVEAQLAPLAKQVRTNDEALSAGEYRRYHDLEARRVALRQDAQDAAPQPANPPARQRAASATAPTDLRPAAAPTVAAGPPTYKSPYSPAAAPEDQYPDLHWEGFKQWAQPLGYGSRATCETVIKKDTGGWTPGELKTALEMRGVTEEQKAG